MTAEPNKTYQVRQPKRPVDTFTAAELMEFLIVDYTADRPDRPRSPTARFFCHNSDCEVRTVKIAQKSHTKGPPCPKQMKCPACGEPLRMLGYVRTLTLEPVPEAAIPLP